jgi:hypothetical protein
MASPRSNFKKLAPRPGNGRHRHHFAIRGLVISGSFVVRQDGDPLVYGPGQIFSVARARLHDEWIEAEGAHLPLVGRDFPDLQRNGPSLDTSFKKGDLRSGVSA